MTVSSPPPPSLPHSRCTGKFDCYLYPSNKPIPLFLISQTKMESFNLVAVSREKGRNWDPWEPLRRRRKGEGEEAAAEVARVACTSTDTCCISWAAAVEHFDHKSGAKAERVAKSLSYEGHPQKD